MKIGLIDADGHHFPNLPLMKISAYWKTHGINAQIYDPLPASVSPSEYYDKVYLSHVFDFTPDYSCPIYTRELIEGGTGIGLKNRLPIEIEHIYPNYELYGIKNKAYGFLSRGCPRTCDFCIVSAKEGCKSHKVADLSEFWRGQKEITLLDPNLLACPDRIDLLQQLIDSGGWVDFTQGLDIRLTNERVNDLIMQCKIKMIHFAWDKEPYSENIRRKLREFKKQTKIDFRKARVYVLTNFDTSFEFDLYRVYEIRSMGFDPYVMIYDKDKARGKYKMLQRWVNNKFIFRTCEQFKDYRSAAGR